MGFNRIAKKHGISIRALNDLNNGNIGESIAKKLGVSIYSLQIFIDGSTSNGLAAKIETTPSSLQRLRNTIGRKGAIGLIFGLLIRERKYYNGFEF
ncbi:hypothetical protein [Aquimarina muelleri]|uniref:Uncharacterized protein n=1 Tax=Aquimarina muelleri TaxID=279356 RepID=A0A918JVM7_9FLAO|nr:hypothetical protein [Aquimarina muelleri]MCX2764596.1 hypothetical protein [Aquimarina muelleri]GGX21392.1 hypothetical protein GCM10007384_23270 [Aquimarina muelleri]